MNAPLARAIFVVLLLGCASAVTFAQAGSPAQASCAIFTIQDLSAGSDTREYEQTITHSLASWFHVAGFNVTETRDSAQNSGAPLSESQALIDAAALNASVAITGYYLIEAGQIYVAIQVWDVPGARLITGIQQRAYFNLAFYSALHDWITDMLAAVEGSTNSPTAAIAQQGRGAGLEGRFQPPKVAQTLGLSTTAAITFLSEDEGMTVSLSGDIKVGSIKNGKLAWSPVGLPDGTPFRVLKQKPGYHDEWQTVQAAPEIHLSSLTRKHSGAAELDWTFGQLVGWGTTFRYYLVPDSLFFSLGGYFFVQPPLSSSGSAATHIDVSLDFGGYIFFPPSAFVRLGLSTGFGTYNTWSAQGYYTDVYWNLLNWWLETRAIGPIIFLRQEWKFATGMGTNLLGIGWMNVKNIPPFTLGVRFEW